MVGKNVDDLVQNHRHSFLIRVVHQGKKMSSFAPGGVPTMVCVRDVVWWVFSSSSSVTLLQFYRGGKENKEAVHRRAVGPLFFKRGPHPLGRPLAASTHLACRGGEKVGAINPWATGAKRGSGELLEFLLPATYSKRRRHTVAAIQG
jgi:hypothetical protein